jgi:hypothetical protein
MNPRQGTETPLLEALLGESLLSGVRRKPMNPRQGTETWLPGAVAPGSVPPRPSRKPMNPRQGTETNFLHNTQRNTGTLQGVENQ